MATALLSQKQAEQKRKMPEFKQVLAAAFHFMVSTFAAAWSGVSPALKTLFLMSVLNIASGYFASRGHWSVEKAWTGARKKAHMWIMVGAAHLLNNMVNVGFDFTAALAFYFAIYEMLSIFENAKRSGIKPPRWAVKILRNMSDEPPNQN